MTGVAWDSVHMVYLLSEERMSTYITATDGDLDSAFELYAWNIELAAALQSATAMVEVVARNAIDHVLTSWSHVKYSSSDWFNLPVFDERTKKDITVARQRVHRSGSQVSHGKILAELSFGFWRFLTSKKYLTTLWTPAIYRAFPNGDKDIWTRQKQVTRLLGNMTFIRNRAAHLEPLFRRDVYRDMSEARALMSWIDHDALAWFNSTLKLDGVLQAKPAFLDSKS
ncbi:hypothetical protein [Actinomyces sp. HMSC065F12]|uniref:hypothetical protein n=1 Tax=Actinomyces sp. HMSC065F12 TaxID=1739479 RepID=UPI001D0CAB9D|nr:hypothetical protein [Actinomyces sp. HMSC065F12]